MDENQGTLFPIERGFTGAPRRTKRGPVRFFDRNSEPIQLPGHLNFSPRPVEIYIGASEKIWTPGYANVILDAATRLKQWFGLNQIQVRRLESIAPLSALLPRNAIVVFDLDNLSPESVQFRLGAQALLRGCSVLAFASHESNLLFGRALASPSAGSPPFQAHRIYKLDPAGSRDWFSFVQQKLRFEICRLRQPDGLRVLKPPVRLLVGGKREDGKDTLVRSAADYLMRLAGNHSISVETLEELRVTTTENDPFAGLLLQDFDSNLDPSQAVGKGSNLLRRGWTGLGFYRVAAQTKSGKTTRRLAGEMAFAKVQDALSGLRCSYVGIPKSDPEEPGDPFERVLLTIAEFANRVVTLRNGER